MNGYLLFSLISGMLSLAFGGLLVVLVLRASEGSERGKEIARAIEAGAKSFLRRQYKTVGYVSIALFFILYFAFGIKSSAAFLLGAFSSALAGYIGMMVAVRTNVRVTHAATISFKGAFGIAFRGGAVTGFMVLGLGLVSTSLFYLLTGDLKSMIALGFGASLISVFARLGGGIYTKAADVGADLVGKVEVGIPEDDPRNPAVIADNVGDNVGDCAGMAADLFETLAVTIIAAMLIGNGVFPGNEAVIAFPLVLAGIAVISFIVGSFFVYASTETGIMKGLYRGLFVTIAVSLAAYYPVISIVFKGMEAKFPSIFWSLCAGLVITVLIVAITDYYTSKRFRPVKAIAKSSLSGHATNIIEGLAVSLEATFLPVLVIVGGILFGYAELEIYGVALAVMSMLSLTGVIIAIDSFGPITDNAGGIAEMSGAPKETRVITDALDAVGNTTKAVTKGYAIASAGLAALVLFSSYINEIKSFGVHDIQFNLSDPLVIVGLFLGAALPYLFSSFAMKSVGRTAGAVVTEVRRQFKEIKGIMEGTAKPDYSYAVDIVTKAALKEMIIPALLPLVFTLGVGFVLGPVALGGFLIGSIISGVFVALSMTSGGGAWDNAKKFIEEGNYGGKGSDAHKAAVTGDTVGDPYKDTAGPAINPMIKVINIVALLIVGFIL